MFFFEMNFAPTLTLAMILLWILLLAGGGWFLFRALQDGTPALRTSDVHEAPMETLRRRYAEGELSVEEYEERKARLQRDR